MSPLPQEKGQESWGMPAGSGGKLQSPERVDSGIFQACERAVGARVLSHLRGLSPLGCPCLIPYERTPERYEIQDHSLEACRLNIA